MQFLPVAWHGCAPASSGEDLADLDPAIGSWLFGGFGAAPFLSRKLDTVSLAIVPAAEPYFEGMRHVLDTVAREKRYLAFLQAPPAEETFAFYRNILVNGHCQFIAVQDGVVVGWCDVLPTHGEARAHVGTLGIAVLPEVRHRGIGTKLMEAAISRAWAKGLSRIELTVRTDNPNAKALYERCGFAVEGINRRAFLVDGEYFDTCFMALVR